MLMDENMFSPMSMCCCPEFSTVAIIPRCEHRIGIDGDHLQVSCFPWSKLRSEQLSAATIAVCILLSFAVLIRLHAWWGREEDFMAVGGPSILSVLCILFSFIRRPIRQLAGPSFGPKFSFYASIWRIRRTPAKGMSHELINITFNGCNE